MGQGDLVRRSFRLLRKQFGFVAADKFQVHATVKGFFKKSKDPLSLLTARLNSMFASLQPFPVQVAGYRIDERGIGLNIAPGEI